MVDFGEVARAGYLVLEAREVRDGAELAFLQARLVGRFWRGGVGAGSERTESGAFAAGLALELLLGEKGVSGGERLFGFFVGFRGQRNVIVGFY